MKRLFVAFWLLGTVSLYALSIDTVAPPAPAKGTDLPAPATPAHKKSAAAKSTGQPRSGTSLTTDTVPTHPFLFFSSEDIPRLRSITKTTHKHHYDRLKRVCDRFIDLHPISPASLPESHDIRQVYFENSFQIIINMSLLYVLSQQTKYKDKAVEWLSVFCDYPMNKIGKDGGYHIGTYAAGIGIGYDLLYNDLTDELRDKIHDRLMEVMEMGYEEAENSWWSKIDIHHDHWLPLAGLGVGAAALYGETDKSEAWARYYKKRIEGSMALIGDDGAWTEGAADWVYAMALVYPFFDVYERLFGENMFSLPFFKNAVAYRIYNYLPDGTYINHHDSFRNGRYNILGSASCHLMRKLAAEYQDGHAQWMAGREERYDFKEVSLPENWIVKRGYEPPALHSVGWSFLWYDPEVAATPPDDLPTYHFFENQGLMILKSGWSEKDVTFTFTCAPLGGHAAHQAAINHQKNFTQSELYHIHALNNSFNLFVHNNYLATPPGEGYQESGSKRHNTLTIEGAAQHRSPEYDATMRIVDMQDDYGYLVGDATAVYPQNIRLVRWYRHVAWLPPNVFVIGDELMASGNSDEKVTAWQMDFDNKTNKATLSDSSILISQITGSDKGALTARLFPDMKMEITQSTLQGQWFDYGQVTASVKGLFSKEKNQCLLTVLTAQETPGSAVPETREVRSDHIVGAVVDKEDKSVAAIFAIHSDDIDSDLPLHFEVISKDTLRCHLFSLTPNTGYNITTTSSPCGKFRKYSVTIRAGSGFQTNAKGSLTVELTDNTVTGTSSLSRNHITVYPNPNEGEFWLEHDFSPGTSLEVEIMDARGRRVWHRQLYGQARSRHFLQLHNLDKGIYFIRVTHDDDSTVRRFMVL